MSTTLQPLPAHLSPLWAKVTDSILHTTKAHGAHAAHWRAMGEACASLDLQQLQNVVTFIQSALPALAEAHAQKLGGKKIATDELNVYTAQLLRKYQRDAHRDIGSYFVPAYNTAAQNKNPAAPIAHYYRNSGAQGVSSAIHAKPAPAKTPKQNTVKAKGAQSAPLAQVALPVTQQADTLRQVVSGLKEQNLLNAAALSASDLLSALASGLDKGLITISDIFRTVSEHHASLDFVAASDDAAIIAEIEALEREIGAQAA